MTELQQYLAEEVAEDHVDGIITRREAIRRLGLLGVGATAASTMLAAEAAAHKAGKKSGGGHGHGHGSDGKETSWALPATQEITFAGPNGTLMASWAAAVKPRGGVLVIHENRGLNAHIRTVAQRFAAVGWSALALDLLSEEGGTGAFPGEAEVAAALSRVAPERFDADMKAALGELEKRVGRRTPLAAIGFCFGGGMVWRLLAAKERRLAAAAPFYGPFPAGGDLRGIKADVLGVYGGLDTRINASKAAAKAALDAARVDYELLTFEPADHAFFNDTGARFHAAASQEAWRRVISWFDDADHDRGHRHGRD
jgi:carboxymethylenebutenolidase